MTKQRLLRPLVLAAAVALTAGGCGGDDDDVSSGAQPESESSGGHGGHGGDKVGSATDVEARTVEIEMTDELVYSPGTLSVAGGEKIRFVFKNVGRIPHDALIGDTHAQDEHIAGGSEGHDSHHGGDPPPFVTVAPGETEEVVHSFTTPGEVIIGCHQAGHYAAGMKLAVTVS